MLFIAELISTKLNEVIVSKKNLFRGRQNMRDLEGNLTLLPLLLYGFVDHCLEPVNYGCRPTSSVAAACFFFIKIVRKIVKIPE